MIEMIVVVAIMGMLLAIAIPVSMAVVKGNQAKLTQTTLETLKSAIEVFETRKPLRTLSNGNYWQMFGPLPPSPTAQWLDVPPSLPETPLTAQKFAAKDGLIQGAGYQYASPFMTGYVPITHAAAFESSTKYPTIECLVFFLRNYSPETKAILDKLGKALTNEDNDLVVTGFPINLNDPNSHHKKIDDLFEVRDAWNRAIQYNVQALPIPGGTRLVWELRSAGADGIFLPMFADPDIGDDVVVTGTHKVALD